MNAAILRSFFWKTSVHLLRSGLAFLSTLQLKVTTPFYDEAARKTKGTKCGTNWGNSDYSSWSLSRVLYKGHISLIVSAAIWLCKCFWVKLLLAKAWVLNSSFIWQHERVKLTSLLFSIFLNTISRTKIDWWVVERILSLESHSFSFNYLNY